MVSVLTVLSVLSVLSEMTVRVVVKATPGVVSKGRPGIVVVVESDGVSDRLCSFGTKAWAPDRSSDAAAIAKDGSMFNEDG